MWIFYKLYAIAIFIYFFHFYMILKKKTFIKFWRCIILFYKLHAWGKISWRCFFSWFFYSANYKVKTTFCPSSFKYFFPYFYFFCSLTFYHYFYSYSSYFDSSLLSLLLLFIITIITVFVNTDILSFMFTLFSISIVIGFQYSLGYFHIHTTPPLALHLRLFIHILLSIFIFMCPFISIFFFFPFFTFS